MSEPLYFLIIIISSVLSALLFINANYNFVGNKDKPFLNLLPNSLIDMPVRGSLGKFIFELFIEITLNF